jgi:glycine dehydrogenase subunit 1
MSDRSAHRYLPHTEADVARMLQAIGERSLDDLFAKIIPPPLQHGRALELPAALDEPTLLEHLEELAEKNQRGRRVSFLGAGVHAHAIPTAVDLLISRAEYYTSYTPYQPEISQGTLQVMFEYQTMVAELFGLDLANASLYDGSTGTAEAVLMARRVTGRERTLVSAGLHPEYRKVIATYLAGLGAELQTIPLGDDGQSDAAALARALSDQDACVVVQSPNFFGVIEDFAAIARTAAARGALAVSVTTEPVALGLLAPPGALGADIAVGEGIGLAIPPTLGGPGLGLFAAKDTPEFRRALPGRLCGETVDKQGRRGYVLTLATREQHIRRERATSNICTNTGLVATAFTMHMAMLSRRGFRQLAETCYAKGQYARERVLAIPGYAPRYHGPTFAELAVRVPGGDAEKVVARALERGVLPGVACGRFDPAYADTLLINVSEEHRKPDIDRLAAVLAEVGNP